MTKKLYLPLLVALVAVLTSCSSKMGELSSDYFTVTPQVLEAVGGKVPATINGKFPEKYFKKNAVVNGKVAKLKVSLPYSKAKKWKATTRLSLTKPAVATQ